MEEASVLIARSQSGDKGARQILIEKNLGLVRSIVKRFIGRGVDLEDLFQIGVIGLIKSIDHFDLKLGVKFSTYAVPMITGEIKRFLRDDGLVKVSRTLKENNRKVGVARQKLQIELGREPKLTEIASKAGMSVDEVVMSFHAGVEVESIYAAVYQEDGSEVFLVDKVVREQHGAIGHSAGGDSEDYEKEQLLNHIMIEELLNTLPEQERMLLEMRYFKNMTQNKIAQVLGISQVQVSRLEKRILLKLRELAGAS